MVGEASGQAGAVTVRAPAKINLELRVGPRRADGYHELATVFHAVALFDDLVAVPAPPASGISITVTGRDAASVPADESNLAVRAAMLLAERIGVPDADVSLHLRKGIPVAGGMAGGSADAAAALVACDALWHTGLDRERLHELAAELGSDVPFSLLGGTAIGGGRGERLTPALARGEYHWVVALSDHGLSTPAVYSEIDRLRASGAAPDAGEPDISDDLMAALRAGDAAALGACLDNDLQPAALSLAPGIERALDIGRKVGALGGLVSGSGPTAVFLARDGAHSLDLAMALTASGAAADVVRTVGPVPGARLVEAVRL
jgi:4-diphosphocytidyl-2-C-methyl-D-erythritol kinase